MESKSYPLISILIPIYNCELYIGKCLESIITQDYPNFEVIIYNDGSTDQSGLICEQYASNYNNVKIIGDRNHGVAIARNRLLDNVNGEFFLFVDADDWLEPKTISFLYDTIIEHDADIATCEVNRNNTNGNVALSVEIWYNEKIIKEFLKHKKLNGALWNKLIRTSLVGNCRFKTGIYYGEDALFTWNIIKNSRRIAITNKPLYNYRQNPNSLSRQDWTADRKGTGYIVWREICDDVQKNYKQYLNIALSRCALEDMWALYFASQSRWPKDDSIVMRQDFIKDHYKELNEYKLDGNVAYCTSILLSKYYRSGRLIYWIKSLIRKIQ